MSLVFLDVETTGLDPSIHQVWEIAYAVNDGPIVSGFVPHKPPVLDSGTIQALSVNHYLDRYGAFALAPLDDPYVPPLQEAELKDALRGATLVGANPAFDATFLRARWGVAPWKYRLLDVEAYAMGALGLDEPKGLAYVAERLQVTAPDHTAAGDVATLRSCFRRLQEMYAHPVRIAIGVPA